MILEQTAMTPGGNIFISLYSVSIYLFIWCHHDVILNYVIYNLAEYKLLDWRLNSKLKENDIMIITWHPNDHGLDRSVLYVCSTCVLQISFFGVVHVCFSLIIGSFGHPALVVPNVNKDISWIGNTGFWTLRWNKLIIEV